MCFAPQRRALFRQRNFEKCSEAEVFLCILTSKCASRHNGVHFSTSQLPKVVRHWRALYILTWKRASRHNGVQFCISHLASAALASLLVDPPELQIIEKTQFLRLFLPFRVLASSFFWLFLFFDLLSAALLFSSSTLTTSAFSSVHIVGSLTSKLPSINPMIPTKKHQLEQLDFKNHKNMVNPMRFATWWAAFWTSHWLRARSARTFGWCFTMQNCSFESWKRRPSSELICLARMFKKVEPRRTFWKTLGAPMSEKSQFRRWS